MLQKERVGVASSCSLKECEMTKMSDVNQKTKKLLGRAARMAFCKVRPSIYNRQIKMRDLIPEHRCSPARKITWVEPLSKGLFQARF